MPVRIRKLLLVLPALVAALTLSACGDSHTRVTTGTYAGESGANAPYLNVGPLEYEVQLSRELNPANEVAVPPTVILCADRRCPLPLNEGFGATSCWVPVTAMD